MSKAGVGARIVRKEDDRLMRGRGRFVGDIQLPGLKEAAFFRSPVAHARILRIDIPADIRDRAFTWADMTKDGTKGIKAASSLPGFKVSEQPALAHEKVRFVGEPVVMCVADTRAEAEDLAAMVHVEFEDLPVQVEMLEAKKPGAALVHEHWADNVFLENYFEKDFEAAKSKATVSIRRHIRTNRQCMSPMEGKGTVAYYDRHVEQLVLYTSTQMPHIVRQGLAECLGIPQTQLRIVSPDVGGGFGWKGLLQPEEVCLGWLALKKEIAARWTEDRREHLIAAANAREHDYDISIYADGTGRILALDAEASVDAGAYSVYPFSACLEAAQIASILPGPYTMDGYRCKTYSVCTNKAPLVPYRGVARTGVCFAMELMIDAVARAVGREAWQVRMENLVPADKMPYRNITKKDFDSGDYPESLRRAAKSIGVEAVRARQKKGEPDGRLIGVGFATYCEQAAHGTSVYAGWGIPMVPGHEQATARLSPDGGLELRIGNHSHGQSMETTLAQVANEILGIDPAAVRLVHGDTALSPYSTGTWGSRSAVMAGGAVAAACRQLGERVKKIGAHLLQTDADKVRIAEGRVEGPSGSVSLAEVANVWYLKPQNLPDGVDPAGLEVTAGYKPKVDTGTFSYASHAVIVAVDTEIGQVEILDYVIVEDAGTMINPTVVEGQVYGGAAQGIGTALYEEMPFDREGQPLASTLADYLLPGPTEVPHFRLEHMHTSSPHTEFGVKGIGEGGAIAPPAAIANAINDALKGLGAEVLESPVTPRRLLAAIAAARKAAAE